MLFYQHGRFEAISETIRYRLPAPYYVPT